MNQATDVALAMQDVEDELNAAMAHSPPMIRPTRVTAYWRRVPGAGDNRVPEAEGPQSRRYAQRGEASSRDGYPLHGRDMQRRACRK